MFGSGTHRLQLQETEGFGRSAKKTADEMFLNNAIGRAGDTRKLLALIGAGSQSLKAHSPATAALTLDDDATIAAGEIPELMGKLGSPYHNGAVWVMNPATWFYLKGLTGNPFQFTDGVARLSGTVDGPTLEGYPVVLNSNVQAYSTKSTIPCYLAISTYMGFVTNRGLRIRRLNELYAGTGQVGILVNYRFGCGVLQARGVPICNSSIRLTDS